MVTYDEFNRFQVENTAQHAELADRINAARMESNEQFAKLSVQIAEQQGEFRAQMAEQLGQSRAEMVQMLGQSRAEMVQMLGQSRAEMAELRGELRALKTIGIVIASSGAVLTAAAVTAVARYVLGG